MRTPNQSEGVAGKGGRGKRLAIADVDFEEKGKCKEIEQEVVGDVICHI